MSVETFPLTCRLVRAGQDFVGKQGLTYTPAFSAESVGARSLHMQLVTIPPGGKAQGPQARGARDGNLRS